MYKKHFVMPLSTPCMHLHLKNAFFAKRLFEQKCPLYAFKFYVCIFGHYMHLHFKMPLSAPRCIYILNMHFRLCMHLHFVECILFPNWHFPHKKKSPTEKIPLGKEVSAKLKINFLHKSYVTHLQRFFNIYRIIV